MSDHTLNIILVDDDEHTCNIFEMVMQYNAFAYRVFGDAESALAAIGGTSPDIIIIDLFLPGLDGYQFFDRIQKSPLSAQCRFVATTAYYTNDTEHEVIARGFDGYIPKPLRPDTLANYLMGIAS